MSHQTVKQECPACKGHGLIRVPRQAPQEALWCPQCEGKGWVPLTYRAFESRKPMVGITHVCPTRGYTRYFAGERLPGLMSLQEFEALIPGDSGEP
jgi:hypothetical protein